MCQMSSSETDGNETFFESDGTDLHEDERFPYNQLFVIIKHWKPIFFQLPAYLDNII